MILIFQKIDAKIQAGESFWVSTAQERRQALVAAKREIEINRRMNLPPFVYTTGPHPAGGFYVEKIVIHGPPAKKPRTGKSEPVTATQNENQQTS